MSPGDEKGAKRSRPTHETEQSSSVAFFEKTSIPNELTTNRGFLELFSIYDDEQGGGFKKVYRLYDV